MRQTFESVLEQLRQSTHFGEPATNTVWVCNRTASCGEVARDAGLAIRFSSTVHRRSMLKTSPMKVIIDTDPGVDDALAILLALASPEFRRGGITTVCGMCRSGKGPKFVSC